MSDFSVSKTLKELKGLQEKISTKVKQYVETVSSMSEEEKVKFEQELLQLQEEIQRKSTLPQEKPRPSVSPEQAEQLRAQLRQMFQR